MSRLLGIINEHGDSATGAIVQDGSRVAIQSPHASDLFLTTLLRERDERVGNGSAAGQGVFDFRYGPFTGGIGETGVIHLSTYGEKILSVEVRLETKHRGIESAVAGLDVSAALSIAQRTCGNLSFAHAHAFAGAVEAIEDVALSERSRRLALIAIELERLYNHLYVITRLSEAAAQHVLAAHLGSLFEQALRLNRDFSGSRFLFNARTIGRVNASPSLDHHRFATDLQRLRDRFDRLYQMSLSSRNYLDRLHGIAVVDQQRASSRSLTGPSLRATGIGDDLRAADELLPSFTPIVRDEGDSLARMEVRAEEIIQSCRIISEQLGFLRGSGEEESAAVLPTTSGRAVAATEGPSGVVAWAVDIENGRVRDAYASTPSLFGFQVFAEVLTGHIFTDFPFALDSFGLSFADAAR